MWLNPPCSLYKSFKTFVQLAASRTSELYCCCRRHDRARRSVPLPPATAVSSILNLLPLYRGCIFPSPGLISCGYSSDPFCRGEQQARARRIECRRYGAHSKEFQLSHVRVRCSLQKRDTCPLCTWCRQGFPEVPGAFWNGEVKEGNTKLSGREIWMP